MQKQVSVRIVSTGFKHIVIQIPNDWKSAKISEVTKVLQSGISRLLSSYDIGYVILTSENIQHGNFDSTNKKYWYKIDNQGVDLKKYILDDGDIILNFINSTAQMGKSCIFRKQEREWIFTTNVFRIKIDKSKLTSEFFHKLLQTKFIQKQILAITQPAINQSSFSKSDLNRVVIYYPPLKEQQKIASILSNVDELIQKTEQIIEQTQRLKKGLMQRLLTKGIGHTKFKDTELGKIPEEWKLVNLEDLSFNIMKGIFDLNPINYVKEGIPFLRISDIIDNIVNTDSTKFISNELSKKFMSSELHQGDLLMAKVGASAGSVEKIAQVPSSIKKCNISQNLIGIKVDHNKVNSNYLLQFLKQKNNMDKILSGSNTTTFKSIQLNILRKIKIPLPSLKEQEKISTVSNSLNYLSLTELNQMIKFEILKKGLMQQLLTGKIRV